MESIFNKEELLLHLDNTRKLYGIYYLNKRITEALREEYSKVDAIVIRKEQATFPTPPDTSLANRVLGFHAIYMLAIVAFLGSILVGCMTGYVGFGYPFLESLKIVGIATGSGAALGVLIGFIHMFYMKFYLKKALAEYNEKRDEAQKIQDDYDSIYQNEVDLKNDKLSKITRKIDEYESNTIIAKNAYLKYLDKNFVYKSYQDIVPICQFIQYLESGRCERLEGADGCYNLYENEKRLDLIIYKLDCIEKQLDKIAKIQYIIASLLVCAIDSVRTLTAQIVVGNELNKGIQENLHNIEVCSKVTMDTSAEELRVLKEIEKRDR